MNSRQFLVGSLLFAVPAALHAVSGSDWPGYLGPTRDARATSPGGKLADAGDLELETLWRRPLGSGYSGISVSGGRAFTMYSDGASDILEAMDATSGEKLWSRALAPTLKGKSGAADGPTGTPAVSADVVYALGPKGQMIAAEAATGKVLWQRNLVGELGASIPTWGISSSPLVVGENVVILIGGDRQGTACALDKTNGKTVWCSGEAATGYQSPALLKLRGSEHLVVASNTHLYGLDPVGGELAWSFLYEPNGGEGSSQPVTVGEDRVLIEAEAGFALFRLHPAARGFIFKKLWQTKSLKDSFAVPLAQGSELYGYSGSILSCLDAETGEVNWRSRASGEGEAVLIDDLIVTWGNDGMLRVVAPDPGAYREIASHQTLDRGSYTTPAYSNGVLFVRNLKEIAAVQIAPASGPQ